MSLLPDVIMFYCEDKTTLSLCTLNIALPWTLEKVSWHLIFFPRHLQTPCDQPPRQISEQFYQQIMSLQSKSKDHLTEKLAQLGVYDLQALKLAVGVLQSEAGAGNMAMAKNHQKQNS